MAKLTFHLIPNAHLDPVWLWEWEEGAAEAPPQKRTARVAAGGFISSRSSTRKMVKALLAIRASVQNCCRIGASAYGHIPAGHGDAQERQRFAMCGRLPFGKSFFHVLR